MALLKVLTICGGVDHAGLSTLVQLESSLKKYVGLVHRWITKQEITFLAEALLTKMHDIFIYDRK